MSQSHYAKIFQTDFVTCGIVVVKYEGWGLLMFIACLSKCSGGFLYILFITLHPVTFVSVDDSTLLQHRTFSSDLSKPCLTTGESLSHYTKIYSVPEKYLVIYYPNKMRSINLHLRREYGKENVNMFR